MRREPDAVADFKLAATHFGGRRRLWSDKRTWKHVVNICKRM